MSRARLAVFAAVVLLLTTLDPGSAGAITVGFDDLQTGEIVGSQYQGSVGLAVSVDNFNRAWDLGVAFDTAARGTPDADLEGPFAVGNLAGVELGKVLILNQNETGCGDGICDVPDDEGRRPAGAITFAFDAPVSAFGLDLIDVDDVTLEDGKLDFFLGQSPVASVGFDELFCATPGAPLCDPTLVAGNGSANRIQPFTSILFRSSFDRVVVTLGGSGAIDNVTLESEPVPEPATAFLAAAALAALFGLRGRHGRRSR